MANDLVPWAVGSCPEREDPSEGRPGLECSRGPAGCSSGFRELIEGFWDLVFQVEKQNPPKTAKGVSASFAQVSYSRRRGGRPFETS